MMVLVGVANQGGFAGNVVVVFDCGQTTGYNKGVFIWACYWTLRGDGLMGDIRWYWTGLVVVLGYNKHKGPVWFIRI